jgi:hypothetical protein
MKVQFLNAQGSPETVSLDDAAAVGLYREAAEKGMSFSALINRKYPTDAAKYGTAFEQFCANSGLFVRANRAAGIKVPTMKDVFSGEAMLDQGSLQAGTVVRDANPASRIMFPAVIVEAIENKLKLDLTTDANIFDRLIATELSIAGDKYEQPVLDFTKPEAGRHQGISQLALPNTLMSITVSDVSRRIPTLSLGMEISDEAAKVVSLDLVSLALTRQAEVERNARVQDYIKAIVTGDPDMGQAALTVNAMVANYDTPRLPAQPTHKAWVKYLRKNWKSRHMNWVLAISTRCSRSRRAPASRRSTTSTPRARRSARTSSS